MWGKWPTHYPELELADEEITEAAKRNDLAILVIGRAAGEDRDAELAPGSYYLTEQEESLLARVTKAFERTIVVVDAGN
ncbi:glycoside hydrolase family 3 C-terminal domain-containing protein, partial [Corynebacterium amycolatum]|uniref:glycoside hydrolase family 3 C-terminal domain-containing protein n=1 Tax=Corynebacterium amycolatum TaxID=43765 RepID=UPI00254FA7DA